MKDNPARPVMSEPLRDAVALVVAQLRDDREGRTAILDQCDLRRVAVSVAGMAARALAELADGDRTWAAEVLERPLREPS